MGKHTDLNSCIFWGVVFPSACAFIIVYVCVFSLFPPLVLNCKGDRKCHWGHERFRAGFACVTSLSLIVRSFLFSQSVLVGLSLFFVIGINSDQDCHQSLSSVEWLVLHEELPEEGQDRSDQLPRTPVNWLKNCKFFFLIH